MHDRFGFGFGFGGGGILMWLFWIVLIVAIVWAVRALAGGGGRPPTRTPLEILEERYARGEISREEFEQRRETLTRR